MGARLRRGATVPARRVRHLARRRLQACRLRAHPARRRIQTRTRRSQAGRRCREARRRRKASTLLRVGRRLPQPARLPTRRVHRRRCRRTELRRRTGTSPTMGPRRRI